MKAVFEQFYLIPTFRKEVLSVPDEFFKDKVLKDNILYQLREAFKTKSKDSITKPLNIEGLAHSIKDEEGKNMKATDQVDASEFMTLFLNRLETQLKGTKYANLVKDSFGGSLSNELISMDCLHISSRQEECFSLSIPVRNKKNLVEGLEQFIDGEMVEYSCQTCKKKGTAMKRTVLKDGPNHLLFTLQRVAFDLDTLDNCLIGDYFELPTNLNIAPFTTQELHKNLPPQEEESKESNKPKLPQSYFEYELSGVIVYKGTLLARSYYSLAQDRESGTWYKINHTIEKFNPKDLPNEAFGGIDEKGFPKQSQSCGYVAIYYRISQASGASGKTETFHKED